MISTTECLLDEKYQKNMNLIKYLDSFVIEYNSLLREVWVLFNDKDKLNTFTKNKPNTLKSVLCHKYGYKARIVNSAIQDIKGTKKALRELKKTQLKDLRNSIHSLEESISKIGIYLDKNKNIVSSLNPNNPTLLKYKRLKKSIHFKRDKLNKKKQKLEKMELELESNKFPLCFGGKQFFKKQHFLEINGYKTHEKWRNDFRKRRNKTILYVGESVNLGNQILKFRDNVVILTHHTNASKLKFNGIVNLSYLLQELETQTKNKVSTTYKFVKKKGRWYLQAILDMENKEVVTSNTYGVLGIDFNVGYITLSEIDTKGNLVGQKEFRYDSYGSRNRNKESLESIGSEIICYALEVGKDVIIESLDFQKKKAILEKSSKKQRRRVKYNKMLTSLAYSQYMGIIKRKGLRNGVEVKEVNPSYTSKIASQKYCVPKKLNTHQGASYVIARRGKDFQDTYKKVS